MTRRDMTFDGREFLDLSNRLHDIARRGVPHAARNALNAAAFEARRKYVNEAQESLILRNKWSTRTIGVDRARGRDVRRMESRVGSPLDYMALQEEGGVQSKKGREGKPIPTRSASGEGRGNQPRRRVVRRPNRMKQIALGTRGGTSRKQRNIIAIRTALASGRKFVFLELEERKGIFRLMGGRRRPRVEMVWDMTRESVTVRRNPMLGRAMRGARGQFRELYREAVEKQIAFQIKKQIGRSFSLRVDPRSGRIVGR